VVKQQIAATIPDSLFMKIRTKGTARDIWEALQKDFQSKSRMVSVDLQRRLQQQHYAEKGDVRSHFDTLRLMREDLASMGHSPLEDDFYAILIGFLPPSYDPYISALNATSSVLGTFLSPDDLMHTITDEYERWNLGRLSKRKENIAFAAEDEGRKGRSALTCFNCGKKGHKKADCWAEGGGKAGQAPWDKGKGGRDEKEDKAKEKEAAASPNEHIAAWVAMSNGSDSEDNDTSSSPCLSLDELLEGFTNDNKNPTKTFPLNLEQFPDSDDEDDEGDLDKWEDDSKMESEYADRVAGKSVPLEGEMEDFDKPEELWASINSIPAENDAQQTSAPIPESIFEDTEGVLLPVPPLVEDEDVQHTCKNKIAMPCSGMQTAAEMAENMREAEEDQAMALWLSDPDKDNEDVADEEDWAMGNEPVEGEREGFDKQANEGNQPIPQLAEPDWPTTVQVEENIPNEKLLLAQLEEQGECRDKAASRRHGEGVDEADKAWASPTAIAMKLVEDLEPPHMSSGQPRGEEEGIGASWETRERTLRRRKVSLRTEGRHRVSPAWTKEDLEETGAGVLLRHRLEPHAHPDRDRRDEPGGTSPNFLG